MAVAAEKNDNDDDTSLGLLAAKCASFCWAGMNPLDLWISMEEVNESQMYP